MADEWRPELYDSKLGFVSAHGQHVIGLLQPKAGESVLDVGCGTGDLTARIRERGSCGRHRQIGSDDCTGAQQIPGSALHRRRRGMPPA